jgi:hypothetical protein
MLFEKAPELAQEIFIQRGVPTQRQGEPVGYERQAFSESAELLSQASTYGYPVFRRNFQEGNTRHGMGLERAQQGPPQSKSGAMNRKQRIHRL